MSPPLDLLPATLVSAVLLPPGSTLLLLGLALLLFRRRPAWARGCVVLAFGMLAVASLPILANGSMRLLQTAAPITPTALQQVDAIVVLGGGRRKAAPEADGQDVVSDTALARVLYAAQLAKASGKPLLLTGGVPDGGVAEAVLMQQVLQRQVGVTARWLETASRTTAENASLSASILHPLGKRRIALVTNAWHMQRAEAVFAHTGFVVTPAPMGYFSAKEGLIAWLPSAAMLANSAQLWREAIGQQAYRWHRYRTSLNTDITPHPPTSQPVSRP